MPSRKLRSTKAPPNAQIRRPNTSEQAKDGNGVQKLDGRANLGAGTQHSMVPSTLEGKQVVVRTYGS